MRVPNLRDSPPFELEISFKKHFVALVGLNSMVWCGFTPNDCGTRYCYSNSQKAKVVSIVVAPRLGYSLASESRLDLFNEIFRMVPKFSSFKIKMHSGIRGPYSLD